MAKGFARKISRKTALSYDRSVPNPIGVTTIAAVNGRGARARHRRALRNDSARAAGGSYSSRYQTTKKILSRGVPVYRKNDASGWTGLPPAKARRLAADVDARGTRFSSRDYQPFPLATDMPPSMKKKKREKKPMAKRKGKKRGKLTGAAKKAFLAKMAKGRRRSGATARRRAAPKRRITATKRRRVARRGAPSRISVRIGGKTRKTYLTRGKGGKVRHLKKYELLGYKSERAMGDALNSDKTPAKKVASMRKRLGKYHSMRERAAKRVLEHGDIFTPNARVIPYAEWSANMTPNKGRKKKRKAASGRRKLTKAERAAISRRNLRKARAARGGRTTKRRRTSAKRGGKLTKAQRRKIALRNLRKARAAQKGGRRKSSAKKSKSSRRSAPKRRSSAKRRKTTMKGTHWKAKRLKRGGFSVSMRPNRRRRRHAGRRRFTANAFMSWMKQALTSGAVIVSGVLAHKVATKALGDYGLSKIDYFAAGSAGAPWRNVVGGLLVAAVGIPVAFRAAPTDVATKFAGGMAASWLHSLIVAGLNAAHQTEAAGWLGGYPDANGNAMGEYILPYTSMQGMGSYYETPGAGYDQAAAGYGGYTQAAAGYGGPPMYQAAAGYPMLAQAAAGTGEYFATGMQGLGEYYETPGGSLGMTSYIDEGLPGGDLNAAEYALNTAEAAAGVNGFGDIPMVSTVDPIGAAYPVSDAPRGSRAGVLWGQEGVFGTGS